jgi:DNA-binding MarR family transcriptional regulator
VSRGWPDAHSAWRDPGESGRNLRINEFLTFHLLRVASIAKSSVTRQYLDPHDLTVPEWRLLASVANFSPVQFSDITTMTTMDKGQVSRTLKSAEAKGLVEVDQASVERREGKSAIPGRVTVRLTAKGMDVYERVLPEGQRYQAGLIELMTPQERRIFLDVMQRLYHHMLGDPPISG